MNLYDLESNYVNLGQLVTSSHLMNSYVGLMGEWLFDYFFVCEEETGKETEPDGFMGLSREEMLTAFRGHEVREPSVKTHQVFFLPRKSQAIP